MAARSKIGNSHDGSHNAFAKPGEPTLKVHHDPNRPRVHDGMVERASGNIARAGAPKKFHPVSIHNGMTERQQALAGMGHANATAPDANPANPLSKEPQGKDFVGKSVPVVPGMKNRTTAAHSGVDPQTLGRAILAEAFAASSADDRFAHGIDPVLPVSTTEK